MSKVFISYVREDQNAVDLLAAELRREGVHVWLDRDSIRPGKYWEESLRGAIEDGAFFLACFSKAFESRDSTYMHEELRLACEQSLSGTRPSGWLIPVLLSPCQLPALRVADDRTLKDLQWIDFSADWNAGVWRLLQVVRPSSAHSAKLDSWLRELCEIHIRSVTSRAWSMGTFRVREIEDGLRSLLLPSRWNPCLDSIVRLFAKVRERKRPLTERWVEPADTGITIVTTISPTASVDTILRSLSSTSSESANPYEDFLRAERKVLRQLVNWPERDLAHWIFALDGDDLTVDLLYWPNLRLMLVVYGMALERQQAGLPTGPIESAYPGSIQTVTEYERMVNTIMQEEAVLLRDKLFDEQ